MATPAAKKCSDCGVVKTLEDFSTHATGLYGRRPYCKACAAERTRKWRRRNRDKVRAQKRRSWARHKDRLNAERRAPAKRERANALRRNGRQKKYPRDPAKANARLRVSYAVRTGKLEREPCANCGAQNVHAHHEDYSKPLEVEWLCPRCHSARHREKEAV